MFWFIKLKFLLLNNFIYYLIIKTYIKNKCFINFDLLSRIEKILQPILIYILSMNLLILNKIIILFIIFNKSKY
jgi:hypothetical protein